MFECRVCLAICDVCDELLYQGERNNGFDVLYQNMKAGQVSSRELEEYLRERLLTTTLPFIFDSHLVTDITLLLKKSK